MRRWAARTEPIELSVVDLERASAKHPCAHHSCDWMHEQLGHRCSKGKAVAAAIPRPGADALERPPSVDGSVGCTDRDRVRVHPIDWRSAVTM